MSDENQQDTSEGSIGQSASAAGLAVATCTWHQDGDYDSDTWATDCGHYFTVNEGTPKENSMKFCCFCGGALSESIIEEPSYDEDDETANNEVTGASAEASEKT